MVNLLSNAIKFTEQGELFLRVLSKADPVDPQVVWIECQVEDTGIGISEEVAKRLFQPFTQGDASTTRKYGGSGLGLAICKQLAERMNGRVTLTSTVGKGSLFVLTVPLKKATACQEAPPALESAKPAWVGFSRRIRVLVAEDNVVNQKLFQIVLKSLDLDVTLAENGVIALRLLQEGVYDLVFMDCHMPEMDGLAACRAFRIYEQTHQITPPTSIIAVTANAMLGERERCLAAGMDDFITKPVAKSDLQALVLRYVAADKPAAKQ